jgi:hypothetical protein
MQRIAIVDDRVKLTDFQQKKVDEYLDMYFCQATLIEPANRSRAEVAAHQLLMSVGKDIKNIHWVESPAAAYLFSKSLKSSLGDSLIYSLRDSFRYLLRNSPLDSLWRSLHNSLYYSLLDSFNSLDALEAFSSHHWGSLLDSLRYSLLDSLSDTAWTAYLSYAVNVLKIKISEERGNLLQLHNDIAASCFAIWVIPEAIILCERPQYVQVLGGKLVDIKFGGIF